MADLDARAVKNALYARHPGSGGQMPGPWTVLEEWRNIDLVAFSAWSSASKYARVGYEVKVSRNDMRSELLNPHKRRHNVEWCNEFYFAAPAGLLTPYEETWVEPDWSDEDWQGERCAGYLGEACRPNGRGRKTHTVEVPRPYAPRTNDEGVPRSRYAYLSRWDLHERITCPTCGGKGVVTPSRVEQEAPTLWVPRDVGLVVVNGRGTKVVKRSPRRAEVPTLDPSELGQLVRWISMRPDPRHAPRRERREDIAAQLKEAEVAA